MLLAADARVWPVGGAGLVLVAPGDPQGGNADRRKRQRVRAAISLEHLLVSERMAADALQLPFEVDNGAVLVCPPVVIRFDQPERLALAQPKDEDQHPERVERIILVARAFEELTGLVYGPRVPAPVLLAGFGQRDQLGDVARDEFFPHGVIECGPERAPGSFDHTT